MKTSRLSKLRLSAYPIPIPIYLAYLIVVTNNRLSMLLPKYGPSICASGPILSSILKDIVPKI